MTLVGGEEKAGIGGLEIGRIKSLLVLDIPINGLSSYTAKHFSV